MANTLQIPTGPAVSRNTVELLLDLVEIKLGCIEVYDRDDARELKALERARHELSGLLGRKVTATLPLPLRRPGRPAMGRPAMARAAIA